MKIVKTEALPIPEAALVTYARALDGRGHFAEVFRRAQAQDAGPAPPWGDLSIAQVNESRSGPGVIRGLHFQLSPPQGKLIRILWGRTVDLALDVREGSPAFGKLFMAELLARPQEPFGELLWLPPGVAHGNFYLHESAIEYFCDAPWNPDGEAAISPLDPGIDLSLSPPALVREYWELVAKGPVMSERDRAAMTLAQWRQDPRAAQARYEGA